MDSPTSSLVPGEWGFWGYQCHLNLPFKFNTFSILWSFSQCYLKRLTRQLPVTTLWPTILKLPNIFPLPGRCRPMFSRSNFTNILDILVRPWRSSQQFTRHLGWPTPASLCGKCLLCSQMLKLFHVWRTNLSYGQMACMVFKTFKTSRCHSSPRMYHLRPKGKWLSLDAGRYLIGRELMILMGFPIHRMYPNVVSEQVAWLILGAMIRVTQSLAHCTVAATKVLHDMAGNSMNLRVIMAAIAAAMSATRPEVMGQRWNAKKSFCNRMQHVGTICKSCVHSTCDMCAGMHASFSEAARIPMKHMIENNSEIQ